MYDPPKILISVPTLGYIHKRVVFVLLRLFHDPRFKVRVIMPTHIPFENNLHHIIKDFLKGGEDYWLSIDADNPPLSNPLDLVALDKDIIGVPTPVWHYTGEKPRERPIYFNAYIKDRTQDGYREYEEQHGLQKVDAIGSGCFLAARRVFEHPDMQKGAFTRKLNPDGTVNKGNDISFCERATEAGFGIYAHFDYQCDHVVEIGLLDCVKAINELTAGWTDIPAQGTA